MFKTKMLWSTEVYNRCHLLGLYVNLMPLYRSMFEILWIKFKMITDIIKRVARISIRKSVFNHIQENISLVILYCGWLLLSNEWRNTPCFKVVLVVFMKWRTIAKYIYQVTILQHKQQLLAIIRFRNEVFWFILFIK